MDQNSIKRRTFLGCAAGGAVGLASSPLQTLAGRAPSHLDALEAKHFDGQVGERFHVSTRDERGTMRTTVMTLKEVTRHDHPSDALRPWGVRPSGFSLLFEAPQDSELTSGDHLVQHSAVGRLPLYLNQTRVGRNPNLAHFEAVIN
jgi:hypothetical protein